MQIVFLNTQKYGDKLWIKSFVILTKSTFELVLEDENRQKIRFHHKEMIDLPSTFSNSFIYQFRSF